MNDYTFGNLIAALRIERGLSQFQLGRLLGVSDKAVSKWENGNAKPRMATCCRLADILGVSLDELLSTAEVIRSYRQIPDTNVNKECAVMIKDAGKVRLDDAAIKRVELHLRTGTSVTDGVASATSYMERASCWGHEAIAVTDHCTVQSFPEAFRASRKSGVKLIPGCEMMMLPTPESAVEEGYPIMLLALDREGLTNLNKLVSICLTQPDSVLPCVTKGDVERHRGSLLVGSSCDGGEIIRRLREEAGEDELRRRLLFYDYIEVQPADHEMDAYEEYDTDAVRVYQEQVGKLIDIADQAGRMVAAVGNARYIDPDDRIGRAALQYNAGMIGAEQQKPHYYRTTDEMLQAFSYLGCETARRIVVDVPRSIADRVSDGLTLFPEHPEGRETFLPIMPEAEQKIQSIAFNAAHEIYGEALPEIVENRMKKELAFIGKQNSWPIFEIAYTAVCKSESDGYMASSRGVAGASLIAFLLGITKVNPLPPHDVCPACRHAVFAEVNGACMNGFDMERRRCPECGTEMKRGGFNIPCEMIFGTHGEKLADITLNISGYELDTVRGYLQEHYGRDRVYRAGTTMHVPYARAERYLKQYICDHGMKADEQMIAKAAEILTGTRIANGENPAGMFFVPEDRDINEFTPVHILRASDGMLTTHFDAGLMHRVLLRMDVLGHDAPTLLQQMEKASGVKSESISISDDQVLNILGSSEALGIEPGSTLSQIGVIGIPGFEDDFIRKALRIIRPSSVEELMRVFTMGRCLLARREMLLELIENGVAGITDIPVFAEDILQKLLDIGETYDTAYQAAASNRFGKGLSDEIEKKMRDTKIPKWYIEVCKVEDYIFPRAHAASYVTNILKLAWYKLYRPQAFYAAWLTLFAEGMEATDFELDTTQLRRAILTIRREKLKEDEDGQCSYEELERKGILEILLEMKARNIVIRHTESFDKGKGGFIVSGDGVAYSEDMKL